MKTIILVRHGKSSWEYEVDDKYRPLLKRGIKEAQHMSKLLKNKGVEPQVWISSTAARASQTALIFAETFDSEQRLIHSLDFYTFNERTYLHNLYSLANSIESLIVFGHNPATTDVANILSNKSINHVPTSGVVALSLDITKWEDILDKKHKLMFTLFPKDFR